MQVDEKYMMRCIALAKSGKSSVAPNPMVGAVIVHQGRIIGEGFHRQYGDAHAEVNAIHAVHDETLLRDSTLYVNLEPCVHTGKTPPCADLILTKHIPRVVIGCTDPNSKVSGNGIRMLRNAGVEVVTDVMQEEAIRLNRFFITAHTKQRPYIILKWAQSRDGYLDRIRTDASEKPVQLSNPANQRYVHKLRSEVSAIMVGTNTAWLDNPSLTVRHWAGKSPVRVFIDRSNRIPSSYHLLDDTAPTLKFAEQSCASHNREECIPLDYSAPIIPQMLHALVERKLYSLLVEGGACLHTSFLDAGLWDELQIETVPLQLGSGVKGPICKLSEIAEFQRNICLSTNNFQEESQSFISIYTCKKM